MTPPRHQVQHDDEDNERHDGDDDHLGRSVVSIAAGSGVVFVVVDTTDDS